MKRYSQLRITSLHKPGHSERGKEGYATMWKNFKQHEAKGKKPDVNDSILYDSTSMESPEEGSPQT